MASYQQTIDALNHDLDLREASQGREAFSRSARFSEPVERYRGHGESIIALRKDWIAFVASLAVGAGVLAHAQTADAETAAAVPAPSAVPAPDVQ